MRKSTMALDSHAAGYAVILMLREYAGCACRRHIGPDSISGPLWPLFAFFGAIETGARRTIRIRTGGIASFTKDETAISNILTSVPHDGGVDDWTEFYTRLDWIVRAEWHARIANRARVAQMALIEAGLPLATCHHAAPPPPRDRRICLVN